MSALWSGVTDLIGDRAPSRPRLRPVQRRQRRMARLPFVIVLIAIFAVGMTGLLMLNTALQSQAFQARQLDTEAARLGYSQAALQQQVDTLRSPQSLAARATGLGMRANPSPAFLILPSGKIIGEANPVRGDEEPSLIVKTTAQIKAEEAAAAARKAEAERAKAEAAAQKAAEAKKKAEAKKAAEQEAAKKAEQDQKKKKKATDGGTGAR